MMLSFTFEVFDEILSLISFPILWGVCKVGGNDLQVVVTIFGILKKFQNVQ
jgi:hypothetical protein